MRTIYEAFQFLHGREAVAAHFERILPGGTQTGVVRQEYHKETARALSDDEVLLVFNFTTYNMYAMTTASVPVMVSSRWWSTTSITKPSPRRHNGRMPRTSFQGSPYNIEGDSRWMG